MSGPPPRIPSRPGSAGSSAAAAPAAATTPEAAAPPAAAAAATPPPLPTASRPVPPLPMAPRPVPPPPPSATPPPLPPATATVEQPMLSVIAANLIAASATPNPESTAAPAQPAGPEPALSVLATATIAAAHSPPPPPPPSAAAVVAPPPPPPAAVVPPPPATASVPPPPPPAAAAVVAPAVVAPAAAVSASAPPPPVPSRPPAIPRRPSVTKPADATPPAAAETASPATPPVAAAAAAAPAAAAPAVAASSMAASAPSAGGSPVDEPVNDGYVVSKQVSIADLLSKDSGDAELARYKASLLGVSAAAGSGDHPKAKYPADPRLVVLESMRIESAGHPPIVVSLSDLSQKQKPYVLKEGVSFSLVLCFYVQHDLVHGLRWTNNVQRYGISVDKTSEMLGSYAPSAKLIQHRLPEEDAPSGMLARGSFTANAKLTDDDGREHANFVYCFDLKKQWA